MARYFIPLYRMEDLEKKINRIRNKGVNVTFDIINPEVPKEYNAGFGVIRYINCAEVEVEGEYKINGWNFVATIQHASPENIIRLADTSFEGRIPEKYRTAPRECEHCHIRRDRTDTYLVYNEDNDEWKQVGRTCLQSYTNGLNAETCSAMVSFEAELERLDNIAREGSFEEDELFNRRASVWATEDILPKAYKYVVDNGYRSGETSREFINELDDPDTELLNARAEDVRNVEEFLRNATPSDWQRNCLAAWTKPTFERRDAGLITSAVAAYLKYRQEQIRLQALQNNPNNTTAGEIGDKVRFTVSDAKVVYYRDSGSYYGGSYPVYKIIGTDGKIYIWGNSQDLPVEEGDTFQGTIKKLSEFRGEKQTEVTRCKKVQ